MNPLLKRLDSSANSHQHHVDDGELNYGDQGRLLERTAWPPWRLSLGSGSSGASCTASSMAQEKRGGGLSNRVFEWYVDNIKLLG